MKLFKSITILTRSIFTITDVWTKNIFGYWFYRTSKIFGRTRFVHRLVIVSKKRCFYFIITRLVKRAKSMPHYSSCLYVYFPSTLCRVCSLVYEQYRRISGHRSNEDYCIENVYFVSMQSDKIRTAIIAD